MKMPVHIFIALGNTLASQFKKEAEDQKKQQDDAMSSMPNLRQMSNLQGSVPNWSSPPSLPNMPNIPNLSNLNIPGL